jgi:hypothetical protein
VYARKVSEGKPADTDRLTRKPLTYDIAQSDDLLFLDGSDHERYVVDSSPYLPKNPLHAVLASGRAGQGLRRVRRPESPMTGRCLSTVMYHLMLWQRDQL